MMATAESKAESHGDSHGHTEELHKPTLWPPFLALSSILIGLGFALMDSNINSSEVVDGSPVQNTFDFGLFSLSFTGNTFAIIGFSLMLVYVLILAVFFYKEAFNKKIKPKLHVDVVSKNLWMWVFLASEIVFFGVLIGTMLILRIVSMMREQIWVSEETYEILSAPLSLYPTAFITFILLMSSVTMMKSVEAVERSNRGALRNWLFLTFLGGVIFLVVKVFEYNNLMTHDGVFMETSQFWMTFYLTTGFHTLHVTVGVLILFFFFLKATFVKGENGFKAENGTPVEVLGIYWHFVDVVWIFLMPLIYLII